MEPASYMAWKKLTAKYNANEKLATELLEELIKKYAGRGRYYHNWHHIEALLALSDEYSAMIADKDAVDFAIFYHDAIYNVLRKDNEARSAKMAVERLAKLGIPERIINHVDVFIQATQTHQVPSDFGAVKDLQYFLDFDMSILGAEREVYREYKENVRKEYRLIPAAMYRPGRKKFLQTCLQSKFIFYTDSFRARYEAQARSNLLWELETDYQ